MPRKILIRQNQFPYHVTTRTNNKDWFSIPQFAVWDLCKEALIYAQSKAPAKVHCFLLMGNHYHLLLSTPNADLDTFMRYLNLKLSQLITKRSGVINQKFSNRYKWSIVEEESYLLNVYRYIYQNPIRAKITNDCHSYPYSSLHFTSFEANKINYQPHLVYGKEKAWLEKRYGDDFDHLIRKGLKKEKFEAATKTPKHLLNILNKPNS